MYAVIGSDCSLVESGIGGGENTSAPKSARMTTNDTEPANNSGDSVNELSAGQRRRGDFNAASLLPCLRVPESENDLKWMTSQSLSIVYYTHA